jgi:hypothetical protein
VSLLRNHCVHFIVLYHQSITVENRAHGFVLHFDNSRYHLAQAINREIQPLRYKRVPCQPDSRNVAISDFSLFRCLKERLAGVEEVEEVGTIFEEDPRARNRKRLQRLDRPV